MSEGSARATVAAALDRGMSRLAATGRETPRLDAEVLLRHVLRLDRTGLFLALPTPIADADVAAFETLLERRLAGTPVAYLTERREFMSLPFIVRPGVLVPRPETEGLVEWALAWLDARPTATVIDIGTGSGAIALSLAALLPTRWRGAMIGGDVSADALAVATANADHLGVRQRVAFVRGDLAEWCAPQVDLLLANLPYLRPDQVADNPELAAEPALALVSGTDGLAAIGRLLADTPRLLAPAGALVLEIDPSQAVPVADRLAAALPTATIVVRRDLAGRERYVIAENGQQS